MTLRLPPPSDLWYWAAGALLLGYGVGHHDPAAIVLGLTIWAWAIS